MVFFEYVTIETKDEKILHVQSKTFFYYFFLIIPVQFADSDVFCHINLYICVGMIKHNRFLKARDRMLIFQILYKRQNII